MKKSHDAGGQAGPTMKRYGDARPGRASAAGGATLIEILATVAMFMIVMIMVFGIFNTFMRAWKKSEAKNEVQRKLLLVSSSFQREAERSNILSVNCGQESDKSWIFFESPAGYDDNVDIDTDGKAEMQKYVLYYTIRPQSDTCSAPAVTAESDDICPHKFIIRKDIDIAYSLTKNNVSTFLTFTPNSVEACKEDHVINGKAIVNGVLDMKGYKDDRRVYMQLKFFNGKEAGTYFTIGQEPLAGDKATPFIQAFLFSAMPKN